MDVKEIIFSTYVICPLCNKKMKALHTNHLKHKHGCTLKEFKMEFEIPMGIAMIADDTKAVMQQKGRHRAEWFRENVMPIGIELSKKSDLVPKDIRRHAGIVSRGKSWMGSHVSEMRSKGWLDLHDAAKLSGYSYNYIRKCASDGRLKTIVEKGIRFTKPEWVEISENLLQENRMKYRPDLLPKSTKV